VEAFENRDNAQISRNVLIALPNDMSYEQERETTEEWDSNHKFNQWREKWFEILNEKFKQYGLEKVYSHKSFEEQGRMEKPEIRLTREEY